MTNDKLKIYAISIILIIITLLSIVFTFEKAKVILAISLFFLAIVTKVIVKKRKVRNSTYKQVIWMMLVFALIYIGLYYLLGFHYGFYRSRFRFSIKSLFYNIIPIIVIVISMEYIRSSLIQQEVKGIDVLTFIGMFIVDMAIYAGIYDVTTLSGFLANLGYVILPSISFNILYNYISYRFYHEPIIVFKLIIMLYMYVIPVIPDVYQFLVNFVRFVYPYIIYVFLRKFFSKRMIENIGMSEELSMDNTKFVVASVIILVFIMFLSNQLKFGMFVVGSSSMNGTLNKGDCLVFEKLGKNDMIKQYDVIAFRKGNTQYIHRVVSIKERMGKTIYITKGDANDTNDDGYITREDIIGIGKVRLRYMGYPTLWVNQLFNH